MSQHALVQQQSEAVKGNALREIGRAGLLVLVVLIVMISLLMVPADDLSLYASHPLPAASYMEAVPQTVYVERL